MSLELEAWNFEAYPHFRISLSGFCAITGEGNLGKSAIARFLRAVLFNEFDILRVRAGAKESVCRIAFIDEAHDVLWVERRKSETLNSYEIGMRDGTTRAIGKAGSDDKGIPKELADIGFSLLRTTATDHNKHNLNFHRQMGDPLFLLQLGEAPLAAFIHKVFRLDGEESALRRMNADAGEIRKVYDKRSKEIGKVSAALQKAEEALASAEDAQARLQAALACAEEAERGRDLAAAAAAAFIRIDDLRQANARDRERLASMERTTAALRMLREAMAAAEALRRRAQAWEQAARQRAAAQAGLRALDSLRPPLEALADSVAAHRHLRLLQGRWAAAEAAHRTAQGRAAAAGALLPPAAALAEALKQRQCAALLAGRWQDGRTALAAVQRRGSILAQMQGGVQGLQQAILRHLAFRDRRDSMAFSQDAARHASSRHAALATGRDAIGDLARVLEERQRMAQLILQLQAAGNSLSGAKTAAATLRHLHSTLQSQDRALRELLGRCPTCQGLPWLAHAEGKLHAA